ncbi:MAG: tetratricopeptide repeat protein, partial [Candidatus Omnitrophica bacterium]|nr:tetratricopeptide repeat protein [Candidatus Omnitrophota bacterium]
MLFRRLALLILMLSVFAVGAFCQNLSWEDLSKQSWELDKKGNFQEAISSARKALDAATKQFGPRHNNVLMSLNQIAAIYKSHERYSEAELYLKKALAVRTLSVGDSVSKQDYADVYSAMKNLYSIYIIQNKLPMAGK